MIPVGRCKCMACNAEFHADEAIYHIKFEFSDEMKLEMQTNSSEFSMFENDSLGEDLNALGDTIDYTPEDELPTECELSLKQLNDNGGVMMFKGVAVRLLKDNEMVDGKTSTGKITSDGRFFYEKVYFGYKYGTYKECAVEGLRMDRTCPACGSSRGLGESMGFRDNYLIMMFGNSSSGKTTWLNTLYKLGGSTAHVLGYKMTNTVTNEAKWTRDHTKARVPGEINDESIEVTPILRPQEELCAYFSLSKDDKEIGFIFRDVAGELLSHDNIKLKQAEMAREFAKYADGILIFRDVLSLPLVIDRYISLPDQQTSMSLEEYQAAIQDILRAAEVEISDGLFKNRDIGESWESLHIPDNKQPAVMYVLNKSDLLQELLNTTIVSEHDDKCIIPFDYRGDRKDGQRPVLSSDSKMFSDVSHYSEFDMRNYLSCALESNHYVSFEDYAFCGILSRVISSKKYQRGITCISSNPKKTNRVIEPLAWLIECLINNTDFSEPLPVQFSMRG